MKKINSTLDNELSASFNDDVVNLGNTNITPGLERIIKVLHLLGNPQDTYQVIHITGTNGKGSTSTFIETGLLHAGFRVGKFTTPHIYTIHESICLNNQPISTIDLENLHIKIKQLLIEHNLSLSPFEFLTTIMFKYFAEQRIDWLVLEVGMGGKNDATNVVNSSFSIITNVALDHTQWLGNTIAQIALEKSGIIKNGITITAASQPEVIEVIANKTMNNYINVLDYYKPQITLDRVNFKTVVEFTDNGQKQHQKLKYNLSLFGKFQAYNFLCAYSVFVNLGLPEDSIKYAAEHTKWLGRLQIINNDPLIIFDGTHNAAGAQSLYDTLNGFWDRTEVVIVTSILSNKNINQMLTTFSGLTDSIIYTTIDSNSRGMTASELSKYGEGLFEHSQCVDNPDNALVIARQLARKAVIITGSLHLLSYFDFSISS
ncbi:MAG: dihydrofolate synthase / folylpolyglutamate synthase [Pseudomonadota bacterium]|nr:dihydrofolate synthase / folylpolyglutamate synthase [Pseudomonadota bacterium]